MSCHRAGPLVATQTCGCPNACVKTGACPMTASGEHPKQHSIANTVHLHVSRSTLVSCVYTDYTSSAISTFGEIPGVLVALLVVDMVGRCAATHTCTCPRIRGQPHTHAHRIYAHRTPAAHSTVPRTTRHHPLASGSTHAAAPAQRHALRWSSCRRRRRRRPTLAYLIGTCGLAFVLVSPCISQSFETAVFTVARGASSGDAHLRTPRRRPPAAAIPADEKMFRTIVCHRALLQSRSASLCVWPGFFQMVYLYTNEFYPAEVLQPSILPTALRLHRAQSAAGTPSSLPPSAQVRATAMGMGSAVARIGLMTTPFVAQVNGCPAWSSPPPPPTAAHQRNVTALDHHPVPDVLNIMSWVGHGVGGVQWLDNLNLYLAMSIYAGFAFAAVWMMVRQHTLALCRPWFASPGLWFPWRAAAPETVGCVQWSMPIETTGRPMLATMDDLVSMLTHAGQQVTLFLCPRTVPCPPCSVQLFCGRTPVPKSAARSCAFGDRPAAPPRGSAVPMAPRPLPTRSRLARVMCVAPPSRPSFIMPTSGLAHRLSADPPSFNSNLAHRRTGGLAADLSPLARRRVRTADSRCTTTHTGRPYSRSCGGGPRSTDTTQRESHHPPPPLASSSIPVCRYRPPPRPAHLHRWRSSE